MYRTICSITDQTQYIRIFALQYSNLPKWSLFTAWLLCIYQSLNQSYTYNILWCFLHQMSFGSGLVIKGILINPTVWSNRRIHGFLDPTEKCQPPYQQGKRLALQEHKAHVAELVYKYSGVTWSISTVGLLGLCISSFVRYCHWLGSIGGKLQLRATVGPTGVSITQHLSPAGPWPNRWECQSWPTGVRI